MKSFYKTKLGELYIGDCIEVMKRLPSNSIDTIMTDPPYGLEFMGKEWDKLGRINSGRVRSVNEITAISRGPESYKAGLPMQLWHQEWATEALRIAKPGAFMFVFGGTRTHHRLMCGIEDAGWEIRDCISWLYGSGFPKSHDISKKIDQNISKRWSDISKGIDNIDIMLILKTWENTLKNASNVEVLFQKNQTEVGINTQKNDSVQENVVLCINQENKLLNVITAELNLQGHHLTLETLGTIVLGNADQSIKQLQGRVKYVVRLSPNHNQMFWNIFTVQENAKDLLKENTVVNLKAEEVLKILSGKKKSSNEEIIDVLCAELTDILKHTILNQSKTFQNLDTKSQMECVSAITVIITKYMADHLILNMVNILKSKAIDKVKGAKREVVGRYVCPSEKPEWTEGRNTGGASFGSSEKKPQFGSILTAPATSEAKLWDGYGTALKPGWEPIIVTMKPLKGTFAQNALKYEVAGLNIDGGRIETKDKLVHGGSLRTNSGDIRKGKALGMFQNGTPNTYVQNSQGRWPANVILDEEAAEMLDEQSGTLKSEVMKAGTERSTGGGYHGKFPKIANLEDTYADSGGASRFFYTAKASKSEREFGLKRRIPCITCREIDTEFHLDEKGNKVKCSRNDHPTVKPQKLIDYLCKLTMTPTGGTVLDMFVGTGKVPLACEKLGRNWIGIDKEINYLKITKAAVQQFIDKGLTNNI